jgi:hypothetical protein
MTGRLAAALILVGLVAGLPACSDDEPQPIQVAQDRISVINMTGDRWTGVEVWLNDHYRVQAPELLPGQRLDIPTDVFIAGFGQRFDRRKQAPFGIEVEARGADGAPVRLVWGKGRRR